MIIALETAVAIQGCLSAARAQLAEAQLRLDALLMTAGPASKPVRRAAPSRGGCASRNNTRDFSEPAYPHPANA